jgi:hypothetical protein
VRIVHADNGHHVTTWKIANGKLDRKQSEAARAPRIDVPADVRAHLDARQAEIRKRYSSLGLADELREFVMRSANARCVILQGGENALRARFAEVLAHARAKAGLPPARYISDVLVLDGAGQGELVEILREEPDTALVIGIAGDPLQAVNDCKLREDLHYRLSAGARWNLDQRGEGLASALG